MLYLFAGAAASGKDTLARELMNRFGFKKVVGNTTRPIRAGETHGKDYKFRTDSEFVDLLSDNLVSLKSYKTVNGLWFYWFDAEDIIKALASEKNYIAIVDPIGVKEVIDWLTDKGYATHDVRVVYLNVPLRTRLERYYERESRNDIPNYEEVIRRILADEESFDNFMVHMHEACIPVIELTNSFGNTVEDKLKEFLYKIDLRKVTR